MSPQIKKGQDYICEICGRHFYVTKGRQDQVSHKGYRVRFCSIACRAKAYIGEGNPSYRWDKHYRNCKRCGNQYKWTNPNQKYCPSCQLLPKTTRICRGKGRKGRYTGKNSPWFGKHHTEETKRKIAEARRLNNPARRPEVKVKISQKLKGKFAGKNHPLYGKGHTEESKRKMSLIHKKISKFASLNKDPLFQQKRYQGMHKKPNSYELQIDKILQEAMPNEYLYVGDGQFILGSRCPDFLNINGKKKLIELFGEYYHRKSQEEERISFFAKYGFDTLIIWAKELKPQNREALLNKIKEYTKC